MTILMENEWHPHDPIPVEATWDNFIKSLGGVKISDLGDHKFENADYLFREEKIIIELKEVQTEFELDFDFQKMEPLLARVMEEDPSWRPVLFGGDGSYPEWFYIEYRKLFRTPIARIIKKANRQIKSTKDNLQLIDHQGIVVFVNDGFTTFSPSIVLALASDVLARSYSSVKCFIYLTVNRYVDIPGSDLANLIWAPIYSPSTDNEMVNFVNDLGRKWYYFLETIIGPWDDDPNDREKDNSEFLIGSKIIPNTPPREID